MFANARKRVPRTISLPAPIGGWNVRDALAEMKPTEAVSMENWWPTTVDVQCRKGYINWATGLPGTVDTIMAYNGSAGTRKLFAFTSTGSIYDVSGSGAVGAALVTDLTNGQWQYVSFTNTAGQFLLAVNGTDWGLRYNGTQWVSFTDGAAFTPTSIVGNGATATVNQTAHGLQTGNTIVVTGSAPAGLDTAATAITKVNANSFTYVNATVGTSVVSSVTVQESVTGVSPRNLSAINIFKTRVWFVRKNSLSAWYLASLAIGGAATEFPFGSLFPGGGFLQSMGTWTIDVGIGIDDNAVFFSSEGEVLVYKGTDPAAPATFALVGLFRQGNPIGTRCQIKYLGDIYVITDLGVQPMSESILTAQVTMKSDLTNKILPAMQTAVAAARGTFGWQMVPYPVANMLVVNVPSASGNYQFAMNTITGSWTKFTGWQARCWETQANALYFGGTGVVGLAWSSDTDNGVPITVDCLPAFNSFGARTQSKKVNMVRPILYSSGVPSVLIGMNYDYDQTSLPTGALSFASPTSGMVWGGMVWGSMVWGGSLYVTKNWQFASGIGYSAAMRIKASNNGSELRWAGHDCMYETGGVLA